VSGPEGEHPPMPPKASRARRPILRNPDHMAGSEADAAGGGQPQTTASRWICRSYVEMGSFGLGSRGAAPSNR
jgi:hypothetical protein